MTPKYELDENGIPRNHHEQPMILHPETGKLTPYTRVSTLAKTISDQSTLIDWNGRMTAAGIASSSDTWWEANELYSKWGFDPPYRDGKTAWQALADKAGVVAGKNKWSAVGTLIHGLVEDAIHTGVREFDGEWGPHVAEFFRVVEERYDILDTEAFVVHDGLQAAGTLDLLLRDRETGAVQVGDLKTGFHDPRYPVPVTCQVAVYASSVRYNPETGERTPLWGGELDDTTGVLVHLPAKTSPPECVLYPIDLQVGRAIADESVTVRRMRGLRPLKPFPSVLKAG